MRSMLFVPAVSVLACVACMDAGPAAPAAETDPSLARTFDAATLAAPVFDLAATSNGTLLAAELFVGVTELRGGQSRPVGALAGVTGIAPLAGSDFLALTGEAFDPSQAATERKLFRVSRGNIRQIADLGAFENAVNPDQSWNPLPPESNPFNIARLGGPNVLVADAAANDIVIVEGEGAVDWVAVLTPQVVSTGHFKELIGCPRSGAPECAMPPAIPAQPVATSIAVGPDGNYYAGELTGFPAAPRTSRIWRIAAGSRHVLCPSSDCTLVTSGLTSIVDLEFGPDGTLYVAELDADTWLGVEVNSGGGPLVPSKGGRVKACNVMTGACTVVASGLSLPSAIAVDAAGGLWVAENSSIPGTATVRKLN
ncbi:MAG: ScyD/ScyE family protein [Gemmatimonadetes bacterium]|nr:ScyD/ScyE family protein [Gemmatimonadota bacterium]